jgi:hypothetical protein
MEPKRVVLLDTNIIIEAVRTGCWNGLMGQYWIVTVEECAVEARSGKGRTPGYVEVTEKDLDDRLQIGRVSDADRAHLILTCPDANALDAGERDLFAHGLKIEEHFQVACADQAAVRVAMQLDWGDQLVSLEALTESAGIKPREKLRRHYTRECLG